MLISDSMAPTRSTAKLSRAVTAETKTNAVHESPQEDPRDVDDSQASQASDDMDITQIVQGMMKSVSGVYLMQKSNLPVANTKSYPAQTKKRREARRNTIRQEHKKQLHQIEANIHTTFKVHNKEVYGRLPRA